MNINLFEYSDYRQFLRDYYKAKKQSNPKFSHRYIAQKVGFSSSSYFSQIIQVQTNISQKIALKFARFMNLNKKETEYFELLVRYNQSKSHEEIKYNYEKILNYRQPDIKKIEAGQYELLNKWYYIVIRQLLSIIKFKDDYKSLAGMLSPPIKTAEAMKAVKLLKELNLIEKDAQGYYRTIHPSLSTGEKSNAVGIQSYLLETLELAKQAVDRYPKKYRKFSTLTLSVSSDGLKNIEEKIRIFRKEILEIAEKDAVADKVCQLNVQLFPMSKYPKGGEDE